MTPEDARSHQWQVGDDVIWLYEARGGYGFVQQVKARVVGVSKSRVKIEAVQLHTGGQRRTVTRFVQPHRLFPPRKADD